MSDKQKLLVEDLTVSFKTNNGMVRAVRGVSFDLSEGETLAIVGESGSGKSVTSRAVMGILAGNAVIDKGRIIYEGEDLTKVDEEHFHNLRGNKIGMIFQDPMSSLNPIMRIGKQITEGMILNGKRLKNKYKSLIHESKTKVTALNQKKNMTKVTFKQNKKSIDKSELPLIKDEFRTNIKEINQEIRLAKEQYKIDKRAARKVINKEWKNEKTRVYNIIKEIKVRLRNSENDSKKVLKEEIKDLKENLNRFKKVTKKEAFEKALEVMKEVGIPQPEKRFKQYPFQFSGGMRQRIVIAIALTANPDILICDEPTTALDVTIQAQILELINKLKEERKLSVIFITHDLGVVANMADRIAVMYAGKIVELGTAEEVFYDPRHPYTWALLSSMPDLSTSERLTAIPGTPPNMLFPPKGDAFAERNKYAMRIDSEKEPPMFKITDTHFAATWLLHKDAPRVEPPEVIKKRRKKLKVGELN